jgi:hypothetical protein
VYFEELIQVIHHYDFMEGKHDYIPRGEFQQAWVVYDVGVELAIIAESDCEFIAFCWESYD